MANILGYEMPDEMYFHKEHTYAKLEEDGRVRVGMTEFYAKNAGDTAYVDLPFEGDEVGQGETLGKLQSSKWIGKVLSPVSGTVSEVNMDLEGDALLINRDPYGAGWIALLEPTTLEEDLAALLHDPADLEEWLRGEIQKAEQEKAKEG